MHKNTLPLLVLLVSIAAGGMSVFGCTRGTNLASRPDAGRSDLSALADALGGGGSGTDALGGASTGGSGGSGGSGGLGGSGGSGGLGGFSSSASSTSSAAQSSSGGTACAIGHLVVSQIRSRGAGGATDEFVELFNATGSAVTLDASWALEVRGTADAQYRAHWKGSGKSVPAWGHFLVAGTGYAGMPAADGALSIGIVDAASARLVHAGSTVDAVCYAFNAATLSAFDATFTCAGTPMSNLPHDDTASAGSDVDASIARKPGGVGGNCTDTGDSAADFVMLSPAKPAGSASPPTP